MAIIPQYLEGNGGTKMKTFNSIEELNLTYNKNTNTYEFMENGMRMNVEFTFNLDVDSHIYAWEHQRMEHQRIGHQRI